MKLEDKLYHKEAVEQPLKKTSGWGSDRDKVFPDHLEVDYLYKQVISESRFLNGYFKENFRSFTTDTNHIENLTQLVKLIVPKLSKKNLDKEKLFEKVEDLDWINIRDSEGDQRSPHSILNEYQHKINSAMYVLETLSIKEKFFLERLNHFKNQNQKLQDFKEDIESNYSIRATFNSFIWKREEVKHKWDKHRQWVEDGVKTSYQGTFSSLESITALEEISGLSKEYGEMYGENLSFNLLGVKIYSSELASSVATQAYRFIPKKWNFQKDESIFVKTTVHVNQTGFNTYETKVFYELERDGEKITKTESKKGSAGMPFQHAIFNENARVLDNNIEQVIKDIKKYNHLFNDLKSLFNHSLNAQYLLKHGAIWPKIDKEGKKLFVAKKMKNPLMVLQGKKEMIPNDVHIDAEKNVHIATGASMNGKSVLGVSIAQNYVLAQSSLPVFCQSLVYTPRSNIIAIFGDYKGSVSSDESRHSSDCNNINKGLDAITENSFVFIDEVGLGIDPEEGGNLALRTWDFLAKIPSVVTYITTHYKDKAAELAEKNSSVMPLAFDSDKQKRSTYKAVPGKIALSSDGEVVAAKYNINDEGFKLREQQFKIKGLIK